MSKYKTIGDLLNKDVVNNPEHYNKGNIECIDAVSYTHLTLPTILLV